MPRKREQIILDLKKARAKLRTASDETAVMLTKRDIDRLLDERLEERGAHRAECGCWECRKAVQAALAARSLGECSDARDVADPLEWGSLNDPC